MNKMCLLHPLNPPYAVAEALAQAPSGGKRCDYFLLAVDYNGDQQSYNAQAK